MTRPIAFFNKTGARAPVRSNDRNSRRMAMNCAVAARIVRFRPEKTRKGKWCEARNSCDTSGPGGLPDTAGRAGEVQLRELEQLEFLRDGRRRGCARLPAGRNRSQRTGRGWLDLAARCRGPVIAPACRWSGGQARRGLGKRHGPVRAADAGADRGWLDPVRSHPGGFAADRCARPSAVERRQPGLTGKSCAFRFESRRPGPPRPQ